MCYLTSQSKVIRIWTGPSFYVSELQDDIDKDTIPPSRITDFRIELDPATRERSNPLITLMWTAPGNDFNQGKANHYKVFCGISPDRLSYDSCNSIHSTIMFANEAGTKERMTRTFNDLDAQIYFGIKAYDFQGNAGDMSNVASIFIPSTVETTTSTSKTQSDYNK